MSSNNEEKLKCYICDKLCVHPYVVGTQESLEQFCEKCPLASIDFVIYNMGGYQWPKE